MAGSCSSSVKYTRLPVVLANNLKLLALEDGALFVEVDHAANVHAELGPLLEGLREVVSLVCWVGVRAGSPGRKGSSSDPWCPRQGTKQGEGGR